MTVRFTVKKLCILLFLLVSFLLVRNKNFIFADQSKDSNISKELSVHYEIKENNNILVSMNVKFINPSEYKQYLKDYWIDVGDAFPRNIELSSNSSERLEYIVSQMNDGRGIKVVFPDILLNTDESIEIVVKYELPHFVRNIGHLYIIDIPSFFTTSTVIQSIEVQFPKTKGKVIYSSYTNYAIKEDNENYYIDIESFEPFSPLIVIGEKQEFVLNVSQSFSNNGGTIHRVSLPLPADTCSQKNYINLSSTVPHAINKDELGNNMATYIIPEYSSVNINYSAVISMSLLEQCADSAYNPITDNSSYSQIKSPLILEHIHNNIASNDELTKLNSNEIIALIYNYLLPRVVITETTSVSVNSIQNVIILLEKIASEPPLYISPQDINVLLFALISQTDVDVVINWGVLYPYYMDSIKPSPYVWITYWDEENKIHTLDIVFQKLNKTPAFDKQLLDKILFFRTVDPFSDTVGWNLYQNVSIVLSDNEPVLINNVDIKLSFKDNFTSGIENSGLLQITNKGNSIITISDILCNSKNINISLEESILSNLIYPGQTIFIPIKLQTNKILYNSSENLEFTIVGTNFNSEEFSIKQQHEVKINLNLGLLILTILLTILATSPFVYLFYIFKNRRDNPYKLTTSQKNSPYYNIPYLYMKLRKNVVKLLNKIKNKKDE